MLTFGLDAYNAAIVAEGIETEAEFKTLRGLGCRFGQGYYLGRPGRLRAPAQANGTEPLWIAGEGESPGSTPATADGADRADGAGADREPVPSPGLRTARA